MKNIRQMIRRHNKLVKKTSKRAIIPYNFENETKFPLNGNCRLENMAY